MIATLLLTQVTCTPSIGIRRRRVCLSSWRRAKGFWRRRTRTVSVWTLGPWSARLGSRLSRTRAWTWEASRCPSSMRRRISCLTWRKRKVRWHPQHGVFLFLLDLFLDLFESKWLYEYKIRWNNIYIYVWLNLGIWTILEFFPPVI